jgi:hypothetical protein
MMSDELGVGHGFAHVDVHEIAFSVFLAGVDDQRDGIRAIIGDVDR